MLCPKPVQDSMFEMHDEDSWSKCHITACCANCFYHYTIALINKQPVASPIVHSMYMHCATMHKSCFIYNGTRKHIFRLTQVILRASYSNTCIHVHTVTLIRCSGDSMVAHTHTQDTQTQTINQENV